MRAVFSQVAAVAAVLPDTVDPASPAAAQVTEESGILEAEVAAKGAYSGLFLGLGAVACYVGGVGIANVMVISVLERRSEIGLRRALGRRPPSRRRAVPGRSSAAAGPRRPGRHRHRDSRYRRVRLHPALADADSTQALYGGTGAALAIGAIARPVSRDASRPALAHGGVARA